MSIDHFLFCFRTFGHFKTVVQCDCAVPSLPADKPSGFVMPVLFFRLCFLRLACGEGGGSSLGLVALPTLELAGSLIPLAEKTQTGNNYYFLC